MCSYKVEDRVNWIITSAATTGFIGWLLGRRRTNAETKSVEIDNEEKEVVAELNSMERLTNRVNELIVALDNQMAENIKLKQALHALSVELEHERMIYQQLLKKHLDLLDSGN